MNDASSFYKLVALLKMRAESKTCTKFPMGGMSFTSVQAGCLNNKRDEEKKKKQPKLYRVKQNFALDVFSRLPAHS